CKILGQEEVKPHKGRYYLERRDAEFEQKMAEAEVLRVYREVQVLKKAAAKAKKTSNKPRKPDLCPSTLAGWVGGACRWLETLHERPSKNVFASDHLLRHSNTSCTSTDTPVSSNLPTKKASLSLLAQTGRNTGSKALPKRTESVRL